METWPLPFIRAENIPLYGNLLKEEFIMKDIIKYVGSMAACAVGWLAGHWLWEEVLEDKMDGLKDYLKNRRTNKKGA